jgi:flagellar biogenesis protein FliO
MKLSLRPGSATWIACYFSLAGATPSLAQTLGHGDEAGISVWRVFASLLAILVVAAAAFTVVRKRTGQFKLWEPAANRRLRIIEISRITPQSALCLVSLDGIEYLVAVTGGGATLIEKRLPLDKVAV